MSQLGCPGSSCQLLLLLSFPGPPSLPIYLSSAEGGSFMSQTRGGREDRWRRSRRGGGGRRRRRSGGGRGGKGEQEHARTRWMNRSFFLGVVQKWRMPRALFPRLVVRLMIRPDVCDGCWVSVPLRCLHLFVSLRRLFKGLCAGWRSSSQIWSCLRADTTLASIFASKDVRIISNDIAMFLGTLTRATDWTFFLPRAALFWSDFA